MALLCVFAGLYIGYSLPRGAGLVSTLTNLTGSGKSVRPAGMTKLRLGKLKSSFKLADVGDMINSPGKSRSAGADNCKLREAMMEDSGRRVSRIVKFGAMSLSMRVSAVVGSNTLICVEATCSSIVSSGSSMSSSIKLIATWASLSPGAKVRVPLSAVKS